MNTMNQWIPIGLIPVSIVIIGHAINNVLTRDNYIRVP